MILLTSLVVTLSACVDFGDGLFECENPKSDSVSGQVKDYYTKTTIQNAKIDLRDFGFGNEEFPEVFTDENGLFNYNTSGCSFSEDLLRLDGASHQEFNKSLVTPYGRESDNPTIYLYRSIDLTFKLIEKDTSTINNVDIDFEFEIDGVKQIYGAGGNSIDNPSITKSAVESIDIKVSYRTSPQDWIELGTFNLKEDTEIEIVYD